MRTKEELKHDFEDLRLEAIASLEELVHLIPVFTKAGVFKNKKASQEVNKTVKRILKELNHV